MSERDPVYDRAKGILIELVVLGHVLIYANPDWSIRVYAYASTLIQSFHMPAFFLISGMLYNAEKMERPQLEIFLVEKIIRTADPLYLL